MIKITVLQKFLFSLLILFLPSQLGYHFWPDFSFVYGIRVDYLSPTIYLTDLILIALILSSIKKIKIKKEKVKIYLVVFLFFVFNVIFSTSPIVSLIKVLKICEGIFLATFVFYNKKNLTKLLKTGATIVATYTCGLSIFQWLKGGSLDGIFYWIGERHFTVNTPGIALSKLSDYTSLRPYASLPHPNALAGFVLVLFLLLKKEKTPLYFFTLTMVLITLLLTESYAVWLSLLIVVLWSLLLNEVKKIDKLATYFSFVIVSISLLTPIIFNALNFSNISKNFSERISLTIIAGRIISQKYLFGTGLGTFIINSPKYLLGKILLLQPVHNVSLLIIAETGLIGLIPLLYILFNLGITLPVIVILITSLFDHYWLTLQSTFLLLSIVIGLSWKEKELFKNTSN